MFSLQGRIAFVTGIGNSDGGWGNGQAIATLLSRQGARVFGVDRDRQALDRTARIIREEDGSIQTRVCDVTHADQVESAVDACLEELGRPDILVNNVGRSEPGDPASMTPSKWREQVTVNLDSAYNCCHCLLPVMERAGAGAVVNVASVAGLRHIGKDQVGYASAKAALIQMTKTSAVIYARRGIRLNCVVPGLMDTPLVRRLADKYAGGDYERFVAHRNGQVPMGRMGSAWDVAHAVLYLVSAEASYVTGHALVVDGGLICRTP